MVVDSQRGGGIALRVEVDHQDASAMQGKRSGKVDRGRGLAHAALLVGDHHDSGLLGPWQALAGPAQCFHRKLGSTTDGSVVHRGGVSRETSSPIDSVRGPGTGSVIGPAMLASDRNDSLSSTSGSQ
ncbi:hypothetical protein SAV31267_049790 [Streptomyces avermitilis]|uniref:Uncharacterized protein n=1 Tax=Streptomyces avermitilis TaxID=33903 RepID=A0A4D4MUR8_STRAX|nr:hypothetical protein SAV31267_049790 [Streptomyces avermitilis]